MCVCVGCLFLVAYGTVAGINVGIFVCSGCQVPTIPSLFGLATATHLTFSCTVSYFCLLTLYAIGIGGLGCFSCGAKGKDNFVMDRDRIVEDGTSRVYWVTFIFFWLDRRKHTVHDC